MDSTLLKGLRVLERLVARKGSSGITELAQDMGLAKSNVHRVLKSFEQAGYVRYDPESRRYSPSLKLWQLGQNVAADFSPALAAGPHLTALAARTDESACFATAVGQRALFVATAVPPRAYAVVMPDNLVLDWCDTAFGAALFADQPRPDDSKETASDATQLVRWMQSGAVAVLAHHPDRKTFEIAAPVRTGWGLMLGAIGITGPVSRFDAAQLAHLSAEVQAAARDMAMQLGQSE